MNVNRKMIIIFFLILVTRECLETLSMYNPLLTYTVRTKRIILNSNATGNISIDNYKNSEYFNGNISFNFKERINTVIAIFHRCDSEGINCEYFQTWTLTDLCPKLKEKNQIWSNIVGAFYPPLECPMKMYYEIKNATIDLLPAIRWYSDVTKYQWKLIGKFYYNNLFLWSGRMDVSIFGYRKRINSMFTH